MAVKVQMGIEFEASDPEKARDIIRYIQFNFDDHFNMGYLKSPAVIVSNKKMSVH